MPPVLPPSRSHVSRSVAFGATVLLLLVGGSVLPTPRPEITTETYTGPEVAKIMQDHFAKYPRAKERHEAMLRRIKGLPQQPVLFVRAKAKPTFLTRLAVRFGVSASPHVYSSDEGWMSVWAYEADENPNTIEFNVLYHENGTGFISEADASFDSAAPAPEDTVNVAWAEAVVACNDRVPKYPRGIVALFTPALSAQATYQGINCSDQSAMNSRFREVEHKQAIQNFVVASSSAAIPCVGSGLGWWACTGGAGALAYISTVTWYVGSMSWSCRQCYMRGGC